LEESAALWLPFIQKESSMPEFGNAFSGLAAGRQLTHQELVRAIRMMIAAEYEAVQLYMQLAESIDNDLAKEVLKDIADEEIVHAGEFLTLLQVLEPSESAFYAEGEEEVRELMARMGGEAAHQAPVTPGDEGQEQQVASVGNLFGRD
jgi:Mn-containing catalase